MLKPINLDDYRLNYPGYYNIYPIKNEFSQYEKKHTLKHVAVPEFFLDENYGRILHSGIGYGDSTLMPYRFPDLPEKIIGYLRVPMAKVPVYKLDSYSAIKPFVDSLAERYPGYEVLLRGQGKVHKIERSLEERSMLFGEELVIEPSFYPSFARLNYSELFIYNLWISYTAMMLGDIGIDLKTRLLDYQHNEFLEDVIAIKGHPHFMYFALGIAQHYGLPSIGLDLTKDVQVASWFASHQMETQNGVTTVSPIANFDDSTLFIFRCPQDQVFSHKQIKPKFLDHCRPDMQDAWFCHTGWGFAKNQIAENLIAAIRLDSSVLGEFDAVYHRSLFPDRDKDLLLNFFLDVKESGNLIGEAKRAFERIYKLSDLHF